MRAGGDDDHRYQGPSAVEFGKCQPAVHGGHVEIEQDKVGPAAEGGRHGLRTILSLFDDEPFALKDRRQ